MAPKRAAPSQLRSLEQPTQKQRPDGEPATGQEKSVHGSREVSCRPEETVKNLLHGTLPAHAELTLLMEDMTLCQPPHNIPDELLKVCRKGDVLLVCKDKKAVQCHSQILCMASEVLEGLFEGCAAHASAGGSNNGPLLIPAMKDDAHVWLTAFQYLYPLVSPIPTLSAAHAADLALLGHKYKVPKVLQVADMYLSRITAEMSNDVGYYKWIIPNAKELVSCQGDMPDDLSSREFSVGRERWMIRAKFNDGDTDRQQYISLQLERTSSSRFRYRTQQLPDLTVNFKLALVSRDSPSENSIINSFDSHKFLKTAPSSCGAEFSTCKQLRDRDDLLRNDTLEVCAFVHVLGCEGADEEDHEAPVHFSVNTADDLYVFKWLQLAQLIKNEELVGKCLKFISYNTSFVVFDKSFRDDLHWAMLSLSPEQIAKMMYNQQPADHKYGQ